MSIRQDARHHITHFTKTAFAAEMPIYARAEGCHIWDVEGRRYLDGLAGLFVVQIGHGRRDIVQAMADAVLNLTYTPSWGATHTLAIEAAKTMAGLAPGDLDRVFFVNSGSEAVDSAIKFARQYHAARGNPGKTGVISRRLAYHGTTMGALSATGLEPLRAPFQPLLPGFHKVDSTLGSTDGVVAARQVEEMILTAGAENIGLVIAEPVQNGGGALVPPDGYWQELRRICDRHDVLLQADEVINGFGRLGTWFGSDLVGVVPDLLSFAKGATSGYAPIGGLLIRGEVADTVLEGPAGSFIHGATWGGHPAAMGAALANLAAMRDEKVVEHVAEHADGLRSRLDGLAATHPMVSEIRGIGYFYAVELCNRDGSDFDDATAATLVNVTLPRLIAEAGLLVRADNRGKVKIMLSPPLVAGPAEHEELVAGLDQVVSRLEESR